MNIKRFFRLQKEGLHDLIRYVSREEVTFATFVISWFVLLLILTITDGFFVGFIKTVLISATVCALGYNVGTFFKK